MHTPAATVPKFRYLILVSLTMLMLVGGRPLAVPGAPAAFAPDLGTAASFVGLAGSTFTNIGSGVYIGDVGVSPGVAVVGFPPGTVLRGEIYDTAGVATQAKIDARAAYNVLAEQSCNVNLTNQNLGGMVLTSGVYCFIAKAQLNGELVLDGSNDPEAVWVFKIGSQLTTLPYGSVQLINGAPGLNVFWQVGSNVVLGKSTRFYGNLLALNNITVANGTSLMGRAFSLNGAVKIDTTNAPFPISNTPLFHFDYLPVVSR